MTHQEVMDGNTAAAYIAYNFSEVAGLYPITLVLELGTCNIWQAEE